MTKLYDYKILNGFIELTYIRSHFKFFLLLSGFSYWRLGHSFLFAASMYMHVCMSHSAANFWWYLFVGSSYEMVDWMNDF
jgi:hypothetical protein